MNVAYTLPRRGSLTRVSLVSLAVAVLVHASLVVGALRLGARVPPLTATMEVVALPPPAPAAPPPAEPSPPPASEPPPAARPVRAPRATIAKAPPTPPPPPAAAAQALTRDDDENGPVDLTDSLVVGTAETYAGKTTAARGTSVRPGGAALESASTSAAGDSETGASAGEIDRSRPPRLGEGTSWSCPFPAEADQRGIDEAVVRLALDVDERGRVVDVTVKQDPANGFAREAITCARSKTFRPGLNRRGIPVAGRTQVDVRFQR